MCYALGSEEQEFRHRMPETLFDRDFVSRREAVADVVDAAVASLQEHGIISNEDRFCARLCLEEALVNAVVHGNREDPDLRVRLEILEDEGSYILRIYDEGGRFDPDSVVLPETMTPGGRGVCLMKHFMERVSYDCACHCLEMEFRPKPQGSQTR
jgi:serine/threonine-protein kinase RsbW